MDFNLVNFSFCILKYLFFFSSICVLLNVQTIYAVFCLILAFLSAAFLSILGGAVFIGFVLIVVYVGAVLIFFLFVTMMLNVKTEVKFNFTIFLYIGFAVFVSLITDLIALYMDEVVNDFTFLRVINSQPNIVVLGYLLYSWYSIPLLLCAFILLIAMVGAIVLLSEINQQRYLGEQAVYSQDISAQVERQDFFALELGSSTVYYFLTKKIFFVFSLHIYIYILLGFII